MKTVILAAGKGTRLGYLTARKPKCLLDFLGGSLLERQLKIFRRLGLTDIVIVTGYRAEQINFESVQCVRNDEYGSTNMLESLFKTRDLWNDDLIVSYGDIIFEEGVLEALCASQYDISVVIDKNGREYFEDRFGANYLEFSESLVLDSEHRILEIGLASPKRARVQGQYMGLLKFTQKGLETLSRIYDRDRDKFWDKPWMRSKSFSNACMTDMLQCLIDQGHPVYAVPVKRGWLEFDSVSDYETYLSWYAKGKLESYCRLDS